MWARVSVRVVPNMAALRASKLSIWNGGTVFDYNIYIYIYIYIYHAESAIAYIVQVVYLAYTPMGVYC